MIGDIRNRKVREAWVAMVAAGDLVRELEPAELQALAEVVGEQIERERKSIPPPAKKTSPTDEPRPLCALMGTILDVRRAKGWR